MAVVSSAVPIGAAGAPSTTVPLSSASSSSPQLVPMSLLVSEELPTIPEDLRRQIAAVIDSACLRPGESPEEVSLRAGYRLNTLYDVIIATAVVDAQNSLRRVLQPSPVEESLSVLLASVAEDD